MATKTINTRIQTKIDTEANWAKAANFKPLKGEVIIYDKDASHTEYRYKIGDGKTLVNALPFSKEPIATSSVAGLVKSATTGTTANRDYNVEVKTDGTMKVNVPWTDNNSHYTTGAYVGATNVKANAATTNGNTYFKVYDDNTKRAEFKISGSGATTVTSDANGNITINSTDTNTHQTVTDKNPTLAWGTKSTVATIGSTDIHVTMPANPNSHQSIKTLDTTATAAQTTNASEAIAGSGKITLHKVAKTGSYNDLLNKPTIPSPANNGKLTIQKNGANVATFTANQSGNTIANIEVPEVLNGTGAQSILQKPQSGKTVNMTGKNPNAIAIDATCGQDAAVDAAGDYSASFGGATRATGKRAFAQGTNTYAKGNYSHAEGDNSVALGIESHAEGYATTAAGLSSHTEGNQTQTKTTKYTVPSGSGSGSGSGQGGTESGDNWNIEEHRGEFSHAEGIYTIASGYVSHSEGSGSVADGHVSHAEGESTLASGRGAKSFGYKTTASGDYSVAGGYASKATAFDAVAIGDSIHVEGSNSVAFGIGNQVNGKSSFAAGKDNIIYQYNNAENGATIGEGLYSYNGTIVLGKYNAREVDDHNTTRRNILEIGAGTSTTARKNALWVDKNGHVGVSETPTNNTDVINKKYITDNFAKLDSANTFKKSITINTYVSGSSVGFVNPDIIMSNGSDQTKYGMDYLWHNGTTFSFPAWAGGGTKTLATTADISSEIKNCLTTSTVEFVSYTSEVNIETNQVTEIYLDVEGMDSHNWKVITIDPWKATAGGNEINSDTNFYYNYMGTKTQLTLISSSVVKSLRFDGYLMQFIIDNDTHKIVGSTNIELEKNKNTLFISQNPAKTNARLYFVDNSRTGYALQLVGPQDLSNYVEKDLINLSNSTSLIKTNSLYIKDSSYAGNKVMTADDVHLYEHRITLSTLESQPQSGSVNVIGSLVLYSKYNVVIDSAEKLYKILQQEITPLSGPVVVITYTDVDSPTASVDPCTAIVHYTDSSSNSCYRFGGPSGASYSGSGGYISIYEDTVRTIR